MHCYLVTYRKACVIASHEINRQSNKTDGTQSKLGIRINGPPDAEVEFKVFGAMFRDKFMYVGLRGFGR